MSFDTAAKLNWSMSDDSRVQLRQNVELRWKRCFSSGVLKTGTSARDLVALALDAVSSGYNPERITQTLEALRDLQDVNPNSRTYGNVFWLVGDTRIVDHNGIEFFTRHAALLWLLYADQLTPAQAEPLRAMLELARTAITRHQVAINYTNIFLMKAWNLVALGEGFQDNTLTVQGQNMLRDWLEYTSKNGITEYLSPTYYAVDIENLALLRNMSSDPTVQKLAQVGLDNLWSDVALHWYAPAERLGGTHSRDYNRLFNLGDINALVLRAGWMLGKSTKYAEDNLGPYEHFAFYQPSYAANSWIYAPLPRYITSRWGERSDQRLSHYLGRNLSIASAEANYHDMDTAPLAINLGSGQNIPVITWTMDGRRDYYGKRYVIETSSGHAKSLHLRPFVSSVQRERDVLFVASGKNDNVDNIALESSFILPADAEYWLNESKLKIFNHTSAWSFEPEPDERKTHIEINNEDVREKVTVIDQDTEQGLGLSCIFSAIPSIRYRFNARIRGGSISLYINFLDAFNRVIDGEHIYSVPESTEFRTHQFEKVAPEGAVAVRAWLYSSINNQTKIELIDLNFEILDQQGKTTQILATFDFHHFIPQVITIHAGDTLFIRRQDAVLALRILGAWDVHNSPVDLKLVNDGLQWHALRLTATHSATRSDGFGVFAAWASVEEGITDEATFSAYRKRIAAIRTELNYDDTELDVSIISNEIALRLVTDIVKRKLILRHGMLPIGNNTVRQVDDTSVPWFAVVK